jgi:PAS domain S-box-containing protein
MVNSRVFDSYGWLKDGAILIAFASVHFALVYLSIEFFIGPEKVAMLWPADGLFMGVLIVCRARVWPALILTATVSQVSIDVLFFGTDLLNATLFSVNNIPEALMGAFLIRQICSGVPDLSKLSDALTLIAVGALGSTFFNALGGAWLSVLYEGADFWRAFQVWWFAGILGVLVTTPVILTFTHTPVWSNNLTRKRYLELAAMFVGLIFVVRHVFVPESTITRFILDQPYIVFPFMLWAALRFDARTLTIALLTTALLAVYYVQSANGPSVWPNASDHEFVLYLQAFLATLLFSSWALFAMIAEMRRLSSELDIHRNNLEELVDERTVQLVEAQRQTLTVNEELQESKALVDDYFALAPVAMAFCDTEMRYVRLNQELADINGLSIKDHFGKRPSDILPRELGMAVEEEFETVMRTGQAIKNEGITGETIAQPGVIRHWLHSYFPIHRADQSLMGIGVTLIEITKIKKVEDQLRQSQKMEALGTLSGGVAHDFNNILYPIFIYANLLLEKYDADSEEYTDLKEITSAAQRAKDLVSQILIFSRRSEGVKHVRDLVLIVKEAMKLMRAALPANITIEEKIPDRIVPVLCDSSQLYQVVVDICTNAGQAILNSGKITIALDSSEFEGIVCFEGTEIHGNYCRLTVTDSGVGMDDETRAKIFDPFFTTREVGQGTGLGLSTVFGIVQNHEGGIRVSSKADKKTAFEVFLPLAEGPVEELSESRANVQDYTGTEAILLVDDERSIRNSVRSCLEKVGYNVTAVADGQEALDIFAKDLDRFDLVVTDQTMPNMTGEQLSHELMRLRPNTPVILCTGHGTTITDERSDAAGISALLQKPLTPTDVRQVVRKVLDEASI